MVSLSRPTPDTGRSSRGLDGRVRGRNMSPLSFLLLLFILIRCVTRVLFKARSLLLAMMMLLLGRRT
jgi:hypothetical protein